MYEIDRVLIAKSKKNAPIIYPNIPPRTEKIVAIRKIFINFFLEIAIGTIMTSGGIGKKELSKKETTARK